MKVYLFVLLAGLLQQLQAQTIDTSANTKPASFDSVRRAFTISSARYTFGNDAFNASNSSLKQPYHKVQLYWDPVYLKVVPFPVNTTKYKETLFTEAARVALTVLANDKKVQ